LLDDLASRDFSINAIAMSNSGKLTDAYDGYNDAQKGLISHIGNAKERFYKNPTLMIKAFSLISELNFKIVPKTKKAISRRKKHLSQCDVNLLIDEFKKMFEGAYAKKAISTMVKLKIYKAVPIFKKVLKRLNSFYKKQTFEEILLMTDVLNGKPNDYFVDYIFDEAWHGHLWRFTPIKIEYIKLENIMSHGVIISQEDLQWIYPNSLIGSPWYEQIFKKNKQTWNSIIVKLNNDKWIYLDDGINCGLTEEARKLIKDGTVTDILQLSIFR